MPFHLAIETSCDETAISIFEMKNKALKVLSHKIESQIELHAPFGGVVPEVAARDHLSKIHSLAHKALEEAELKASELDSIFVTMGPGLIGALMVGVLYARGLALSLNKPLIGVNHIDAHLLPALLLEAFDPKTDLNKELLLKTPLFPCLGLTVSGGHCLLSYFESLEDKRILGRHIDDACGEAFDKVSKILGFSYPGGPVIERLALKKQGEHDLYKFPYKLSSKVGRYHFSYSGLKTALMNEVRKNPPQSEEEKAELAWSFQEAALKQLLEKVKEAIADFKDTKALYIAGGVAQNKRFRALTEHLALPVFFAPPSLCSDNATMIGLGGLYSQMDGFAVQPFSKYKF
jgi:N6-L-threonylcarbamoyladenine synthase